VAADDVLPPSVEPADRLWRLTRSWRSAVPPRCNTSGWSRSRSACSIGSTDRGAGDRTVQEILGHKTLAMTLRYVHLSSATSSTRFGALDGERTGTATGTEERVEKVVARGSAKAVELPMESNGGGLDRTADYERDRTRSRRARLTRIFRDSPLAAAGRAAGAHPRVAPLSCMDGSGARRRPCGCSRRCE
jgi:hypothetical protein